MWLEDDEIATIGQVARHWKEAVEAVDYSLDCAYEGEFLSSVEANFQSNTSSKSSDGLMARAEDILSVAINRGLWIDEKYARSVAEMRSVVVEQIAMQELAKREIEKQEAERAEKYPPLRLVE